MQWILIYSTTVLTICCRCLSALYSFIFAVSNIILNLLVVSVLSHLACHFSSLPPAVFQLLKLIVLLFRIWLETTTSFCVITSWHFPHHHVVDFHNLVYCFMLCIPLSWSSSPSSSLWLLLSLTVLDLKHCRQQQKFPTMCSCCCFLLPLLSALPIAIVRFVGNSGDFAFLSRVVWRLWWALLQTHAQ